MQSRMLGQTGLSIAPLVLGGNVFGWTIDEGTSFKILDSFVDHGFDTIDTADCYSAWAPGNKGGESESIIGNWLAARPGWKGKIKIFTKVAWLMAPEGVTAPIASATKADHVASFARAAELRLSDEDMRALTLAGS